MSNTMRAIAAPMMARSTRCCASAPIDAPTSSTIDSPRSVGHIAASAGRSIMRQHVQADLGHRHQRAGVAGRDRAIGLALLDRLDRPPHRGGAPPRAQRLARLVGHLDRDLAVADCARARSFGNPASSGAIAAWSPNSRKRDVRTALKRDRGGLDHDRRAVIAAHHVERYADVLFHSVFCPEGSRPAARGLRSPRQYVAARMQ